MKGKKDLQQIQLKNIEPVFMDKGQTASSQVWGNNHFIKKGDHFFIVAPSGSGKTSLINFIYGLRTDYTGNIHYDDVGIRNISTEEFAPYRQKNISIVFQDLRLFPELTARQNIELKRALCLYYPMEMIDQMADDLGIKNKLDQITQTCSYGEQQRIAIIRSLMQPFDFLLLDEPFSHLDESNKNKALNLITSECKKRNASMVLAGLSQEMFSESDKVIHL